MRERRKEPREGSEIEPETGAKLRKLGIPFQEFNNGYHLVITRGATTIDFWPTRGKFASRADKLTRTGFDAMVAALKSS